MDYLSSPDYLRAADLHNLGSGGTSFFSDPVEATGEAIDSTVNFVSKIPAFAISSVASGVNSIYNSGVVAGNFFGLTDAKENDLAQTLGSYDTNLGQYYQDHKEATDLAGFVATSFIPGLAGIKAVNAGQTLLAGSLKSGGVAKGLAEATGLIPTLTAEGKTLATIAGEALAKGQQTFTVMDAGVLKALAGGVGQAAVESIAFEAMVQATMFRSPILEGQDLKDIGSNLLVAGVFGGAVGGAFAAAKVYGTVTSKMYEADAAAFGAKVRTSTAGLDVADKAIVALHDIKNIPIGADQVLVDKKIISAWQDVRKSIHSLVGRDESALGNILGDMVEASGADQAANVLHGAKAISRVGAIVPKLDGDLSVAYVRIHGAEGVGDVKFERALGDVTSLADTFGTKAAVDSAVLREGFSEYKLWNMSKAPSPQHIESRYVWADKFAKYEPNMLVDVTDIPLQEGALKRGLEKIRISEGDGTVRVVSAGELAEEVLRNKHKILDNLGAAASDGWNFPKTLELAKGGLASDVAPLLSSAEIAKAANVTTKFAEGNTGASAFARQDAQAAFDAMRAAGGKPIGEISDLTYIPQHVQVLYDGSRAAHVDSDIVSAMVHVEEQRKILTDKVMRGTAGFFGPLDERFVKITSGEMATANRGGAGAGIISSANGEAGSLAAKMEYIGKATAELIDQTKKNTMSYIESAALRLRGDQEGAIEFSRINDLRNSTTEHYVKNEMGDGLISAKVKAYLDKQAKGTKNLKEPILQEGAPHEILIKNESARAAVFADIDANGYRITQENSFRMSEGSTNEKVADRFYGWKPDPKSMPHFAFVKDTTISGEAVGHTSMIHAATEKQLQDMIDAVRTKTGFKVFTKADTEDFFKSQRAYEFDRTLHENYIDSGLKSAGINNQFFPRSDPDSIVTEWLASHSKRDSMLARDAVATRYANEFDQLDSLGKYYNDTASSQYGVTVKGIENTVKNPYNDYRKTALNISRLGEYPFLSSVNRGLENAVSGTVQKIVDAWATVKGTGDLDRVNASLKNSGISHSYGTAAEMVLANHIATKPYLSNFVRGANTILANTFLRLDFLNPIANAIGAQVLLGAETSSQVRKAMRGVESMSIEVPGTGERMLSAPKLIAKANAAYLSKTPELDTLFASQGLLPGVREQLHQMLDDVAIRGTENQAELSTRLSRALETAKSLTDKGEKITGNKLAEHYNRWISSFVAKEIADVQIAAGVMPKENLGMFMNTFVNRTQTNALASQRPLLFQGPVGQAIGLFQSFQFNTMQQVFRHVSEGAGKDAAMAMGLQGTIFGLNGLPGFQYINQHIVGTASGNPNHTDAYSLLYGAAGKTAGDWLMYGIPSNMLQANLYSRGDINPRTLTVVPTSPGDVIAVSAFSKFAGNLKETLGKMAGGGDVWQSVLQGLEHNGLSRPLAGLAQTLQAADGGKVFSTTNGGDISATNDLMSLATLSRLAGGKPLDEAIANDEVARKMVYQAADKTKMKAATEMFKTTVIGDTDGTATPEAVHNYLEAFVKSGGKPESFNKNMLNAITTANTPKANLIMQSLKGPYAEHMKLMMGGTVEDLSGQ